MARLKFAVRSSSSDAVYDLEAYRTTRGIRFNCTCEAAENGTHCKHRLSLLSGDSKALDKSSKSTVAELKELFDGSETMSSVQRLLAMEADLAKLQRAIKAEKKAIAAAFYG